MIQYAFMMALLLAVPSTVFGHGFLKLNRQQKFSRTIPAGNYSGITPIGNDRYAVVCDKSVDGFFVFHLELDSLTGKILHVENEGFRASGYKNRDQEDIVFHPASRTLYICGEADNEIYEYSLDGKRTRHRLHSADRFRHLSHDYGLEALCYDSESGRFYAMSEHPAAEDSLIRLTAFDEVGTIIRQWSYRLDATPKKHYGRSVCGVSALCALGEGRLLVLERTIRVPRIKIGSWVETRLYEIIPTDDALLSEQILEKRLICRFRTHMNLFRQNLANYEGMCVAKHEDGNSTILLLIADSQNQYHGLLRDWMRTVIIQ
jgi:hypothetical protein